MDWRWLPNTQVCTQEVLKKFGAALAKPAGKKPLQELCDYFDQCVNPVPLKVWGGPRW